MKRIIYPSIALLFLSFLTREVRADNPLDWGPYEHEEIEPGHDAPPSQGENQESHPE